MKLYYYKLGPNVIIPVIPAEPRWGESRNPYMCGKVPAQRPILLDPGSRPAGAGLGRDDGNDPLSGKVSYEGLSN
jgi:hypothetical protein